MLLPRCALGQSWKRRVFRDVQSVLLLKGPQIAGKTLGKPRNAAVDDLPGDQGKEVCGRSVGVGADAEHSASVRAPYMIWSWVI